MKYLIATALLMIGCNGQEVDPGSALAASEVSGVLTQTCEAVCFEGACDIQVSDDGMAATCECCDGQTIPITIDLE